MRLIDATSRRDGYEDPVVPVAAALKALTLMADHHDGDWQTWGDKATDRFGAVISGVAASPDRRETLADLEAAR